MPEKIDNIVELVKAHLKGELSEEGMRELNAWMREDPVNKSLVEEFLDEEKLRIGIAESYWVKERVWEQLQYRLSLPGEGGKADQHKGRLIWFKRKWWAVAASIIAILGIGLYFYIQNSSQPAIAKVTLKDIPAPATNRAMITLADGSKVFLDSAGTGQLAQQGNIKLLKIANGQIAYQTADGQILKELQYNTLTNPRGSKVINMTLADGSKVWLNAGSSITYPVAFIESERSVTLEGEGYFEVAKDPAKKFIVTANGTTTEVLGTHFNIAAYNNESTTKITLFEGSVRATSGDNAILLKPGQQAIANNKQLNMNDNPDLNQVMAWKNGVFNVNHIPIADVMREIANWYDVEVAYPNGVPDVELFGKMGRELKLSEILQGLREMDLKCRLEGHRLIVE